MNPQYLKDDNYTIPSDNRELQPYNRLYLRRYHYTIPSDNRELQPDDDTEEKLMDYTIPSDNRELQQSRYQDHILAIIPYQVITGNYNNHGIKITS